MSLFTEKISHEDNSVPLRSLKVNYAMDNSGSTGCGNVLNNQKLAFSMLNEYLRCNRLIKWNSFAKIMDNINNIFSEGGTDPNTFLKYLEDDCQLLVIYTDGQIWDMNRFKSAIDHQLKEKMPIIIVFTLDNTQYTFENTIKEMERQVNMSIPESCISFSDDVLLLVNLNGSHKTLMSKGIFTTFGQPILDMTTKIGDLPDCDLSCLTKLRTQSPLPPGFIRLNNFSDPVNLKKVYQANINDNDIVKQLFDQLLPELCQRIYLPNLDLTKLHSLLVNLSRKMTENPELKKTQDELARIATGNLAGSDEHKALIKKLHLLRKKPTLSPGNLKLINKWLSMIADYRSGSTSFVLGSNRANAAKTIDESNFHDRGECLRIECPIMLDDGDACILIKSPTDKSDLAGGLSEGNHVSYLATTDLAMEAPFWCGWSLRDCLTPGLYGYDFAESAYENPYTREKVIGYIPLSKDPMVVMRFMSKNFGHSKELWHMVRAYIAMISYNLDKEWCPLQLKEHLDVLLDNYHATKDLRGGTEKVPLRESLGYVVENYAECLRNRYPKDIEVIIYMVERLLSGRMTIDLKTKIMGMVKVIDEFSQLLKMHKARDNMMLEVIEVDSWGHYKCQKNDLRSLIGYIFWKQDCERKNEYRGLKLQIAVDTVLTSDPLGPELLKAFNGKKFSIPPVSYSEPVGTHFTRDFKHEKFNQEGRPKDYCIYCGYKFKITNVRGHQMSDRKEHFKEVYGKHFYNGQKAVLTAIGELGSNEFDQKIFKLTKKILFREYGEMAGFLHTDRCKFILTHLIKNLKKVKN